MGIQQTFYEAMREHGITRRSFLKFCSLTAAGHQAEEILEQTLAKYDGNFILACEGNSPLNEDGIYCIQAGQAKDVLQSAPA